MLASLSNDLRWRVVWLVVKARKSARETGTLLGITRKTLNSILCRFRRHGDVMSILTREQSLIPIEYFLRHPSAYLSGLRCVFFAKSKSGFLNLKADFAGFFSLFF